MPEPIKFEFDVCLSHSAEDMEVVSGIAERLREGGLQVWFDKAAKRPKIKATEAKNEPGPSRVLVLCISKNVFGAEWERLIADTLPFRDPTETRRRFVLLRLDEAPVKRSLAHFLPLSWRADQRNETYARLLEICQSHTKSAIVRAAAIRKEASEKIIRLKTNQLTSSFAFSSNKGRVITGSPEGLACLWDVQTGRMIRKFEGHRDRVKSVVWSKDERCALSGSDDDTVRVWDIKTGRCLEVLDTGAYVSCVAWTLDQSRVLVGSGLKPDFDIWDVSAKRRLQTLKWTTGVLSVAWSADESNALSGGVIGTICVWDSKTGRRLRLLEGHVNSVNCVAWGMDNRHVLSGSDDTTVRLWDVERGHCLRVLEGHAKRIRHVAWSADQRYAVSGSEDRTVRLWDLETGRCICVLEGHEWSVQAVAWSVDQSRVFSGDLSGRIRIWNLSELTSHAGRPKVAKAASQQPQQIQYTSAKVLLVGDTGVGKSGLAERLVHKKFMPTKSSHARKAYVLESNVAEEANSVALHRETVLWDLAGQPAYRLVHQLSMENAALACVLFDNRREMNPFEGPAYWSQALDQARTNIGLKKILVASRTDVGGVPASKDRIDAFCRENGFAQFIPTSAYTAEGCNELLGAILEGVPWDKLPKVTTVGTLASVRNFVGRLKERNSTEKADDGKPLPILLTVASLHEGLSADSVETISFDELVAHLHRLEATDAIDLLVFNSTGADAVRETFVLLDSTRVDAYASALLVAAKDEPDGPGHLLESRVRAGQFKLDQEERIADRTGEAHLLWFVIEKLLSRDLALRERINEKDYIVVPSQCTAELKFPGVAAFGVAFSFSGPIRAIYATLIAQLAHYKGFSKREFFQDAAAYRVEAGGRCILRLHDGGNGEAELEVSFEGKIEDSIRQGFLEFVGNHLENRSNADSVRKRYAFHCANSRCAKPFDDQVVKANLDSRRKDLICPYCRKLTPLVNLLKTPTMAAESVALQIDADAKRGRQHMTAALIIKAKETEKKFDVFLSHNSKDKAAVRQIEAALKRKGIRSWFDEDRLIPGRSWMKALQEVIPSIPCAIVFFGPAGIGPWEQEEMEGFLLELVSKGAGVIPVILPDAPQEPMLPTFLKTKTWVNMRDWRSRKDESFYLLLCGILGQAPGDSSFKRFGARDIAELQGMVI